MRIIAGEFRHRAIQAPEGLTTRPMTDRVRENLFNLLGQYITGATVLDLFCGSGALGLESLSRGATFCQFVDTDLAAIQTVRDNCRTLNVENSVRITQRDALKPSRWILPPAGMRYTHLFCDPPYKMTADTAGQGQLARMAETLTGLDALAPSAIAMLRAERGIAVALPWPGFTLVDERSYGTTTLYLMENSA